MFSGSIMPSSVVFSHVPWCLCRNENSWSYLFFRNLTSWLLSTNYLFSYTSATSLLVSFGCFPWPTQMSHHLQCILSPLLSLTCPVKLMASVMVSVQMTSKMSLPILTSLPNSSTIFLKTHVYKYIHRYPAGNCTEFIFKSGAFHLWKISQIYTSLSLSSIWRDRYLIHPFIKHLLRSN